MMQNQRLGPLLARAAAVQNMAAALPAAPAPQQPLFDTSPAPTAASISMFKGTMPSPAQGHVPLGVNTHGLDVSESKAGLGIDFGSDALWRSLGAAPGVTAGACVAGERERWCGTGVLTNFSQAKAAGFQLANASELCVADSQEQEESSSKTSDLVKLMRPSSTADASVFNDDDPFLRFSRAITRREALTGASSAKRDEKHGCSVRAKGKGRD